VSPVTGAMPVVVEPLRVIGREVHQHVTQIGRDGRQRPMCENSHRGRFVLALPPCLLAP
jgi:hypothetical protein